jgi:hypothetical protein
VGLDGFERVDAGDALDHLGRGQHMVHAPAIGLAHVHVLDEAQHHGTAVLLAKPARHRQDLAVVGAALDHHVDLDRPQPGCQGGLDAGQHIGDRKPHVVHLLEDRVVERVQADGDALQARVGQGPRLLDQQRAIGGQREVERFAVGASQLGQHAHQHLEVAPQQRLAAGQADLLDAVRGEHARQAGDLLEAEQRALRQEGVVAVEHLLGHAIAAAEVAAVGDRDAQVAQRPAQGVGQQAVGGARLDGNARHRRKVALVGNRDHWQGGFAHPGIVPRRRRP